METEIGFRNDVGENRKALEENNMPNVVLK